MGGVESKAPCEHPINPDILSVITLSDAAVQRLPLAEEDGPLEKETRNQNIDDYWRERLDCMEQQYAESLKITENEFRRLEFKIKKMSPGRGKLLCPRMIEDTQSCYLAYPKEPLNCSQIVQKLQLCLDTIMQESAKKRFLDDQRKNRNGQCKA